MLPMQCAYSDAAHIDESASTSGMLRRLVSLIVAAASQQKPARDSRSVGGRAVNIVESDAAEQTRHE